MSAASVTLAATRPENDVCRCDDHPTRYEIVEDEACTSIRCLSAFRSRLSAIPLSNGWSAVQVV